MTDKLTRKLLNAYVFAYLMRLERKRDVDVRKQTARQNKRIQRLMVRAYQIPFYRRRFDEVGLVPADFTCEDDLRKFPLLTKDELREWMNDEIGKEQYSDYYLDTTSGSSGTPTRVLYSPKEKAWNIANWIRVLMKTGYDPIRGKTVSRLSAHSASADKKNLLQRIGILRREFVNQYESEDKVLQSIKDLQPDLLYMNKTELMRVALYCDRNGLQAYRPRYFIPTGEKIDERAQNLLTKVFGPGLVDSFGTAETGACMIRYPGEKVHYVHRDLFAVFVDAEEGKSEETDGGKLVVTPLYKSDVPLINYVVGDGAKSSTVNGVTVISEIQGRLNDFILHANGKATTFFMIAPIFAHQDNVLQMRVIQRSYDTLVVQAVMDSHSTVPRSQIEEEIVLALNAALQEPMDVRVEWHDVIEPDANGKLRLIVNEMEVG